MEQNSSHNDNCCKENLEMHEVDDALNSCEEESFKLNETEFLVLYIWLRSS